MKFIKTVCWVTSLFMVACQQSPKTEVVTINAADYGAVGDGITLNTKAFNEAIQAAPENAIVRISDGKFLTGTIHLKSNMTLLIDETAEIIGTDNLDEYDHYKPTKDMTKYDTGEGGVNANLTGDERWTKALILGQNLTDVTIQGEGLINGMHVRDSLGEESMRGPHTILIAESENVNLKGFNITCASNYAVLGYELVNSTVEGLTITEGWDGVHIRGGENLVIKDCDIQTGDDAIAGGYWTNMRVTGCKLNSSCNGLRMLEPSNGLEIDNCYIYGPGNYAHRTSGELKRNNLLYGIVIEPGAWGDAPGDVRNVYIHDVEIVKPYSPIAYSMGDDNHCYDITIENVEAKECTVTIPFNRQECIKMWDKVTVSNMSITGRTAE